MNHLAAWVRRLWRYLQHKKKGFRCSFAHQHCGRNATKLITASIKSPVIGKPIYFNFA